MDLGSKGKTPRVGARLKALDEAVLMAASDFSCNFFRILTSGLEQCDQAWPKKKLGNRHPQARQGGVVPA